MPCYTILWNRANTDIYDLYVDVAYLYAMIDSQLAFPNSLLGLVFLTMREIASFLALDNTLEFRMRNADWPGWRARQKRKTLTITTPVL